MRGAPGAADDAEAGRGALVVSRPAQVYVVQRVEKLSTHLHADLFGEVKPFVDA
jgi:hypothetical protein